jgi:hypothetical protein
VLARNTINPVLDVSPAFPNTHQRIRETGNPLIDNDTHEY